MWQQRLSFVVFCTCCGFYHAADQMLVGQSQVLHMMLGLERVDRMRLFADELTAVAAPRIARASGSGGGGNRRRVADAAADDAGSQRAGRSGASGRRVSHLLQIWHVEVAASYCQDDHNSTEPCLKACVTWTLTRMCSNPLDPC